MTDTLAADVRAACDAVAKSPHSECGFPKCWCSLSDRVDILDYLLTTARAQATEAAARVADGLADTHRQVADDSRWTMPLRRQARTQQQALREAAAAIRAPATQDKDPTP